MTAFTHPTNNANFAVGTQPSDSHGWTDDDTFVNGVTSGEAAGVPMLVASCTEYHVG